MHSSDRGTIMKRPVCILAAALAAVATACAAQAQSPEKFYQGQQVRLYIGFGPGGGYDAYARLVARHMARHIPGNPTIVPTNMPGAGSLRLANWLYNAAPKDGTALATVSRGAPFEPLIGNASAAQFDATKFTWIGSANDEVSTCVAWGKSGITSFDDLRKGEAIFGGDGPAADPEQFTRALNGVLGTKIKIVSGYSGGNDINLAMERGEVNGRCGASWSSIKATHKQWVSDGTIKILVQLALAKHPDLPDVPLVLDLAQSDEQKDILRLIFARQSLGRPFLAPPGVPADRAEALRKAFMDTMRDPEFLAEADKAQFEITPVSGEDLQTLLEKIFKSTPPSVAERTRKMLGE
jgi:tripartite-type tricarboxylate transporter receptor subunit TctC